ncbi:conserved hypothetical protein [Cenarchaeum symbiosum A]|uniref:PEFG-CTERM sorting domain-containing protein n=1 Tax=Cenarchaeum symbiosum (strain A) TaxID=414004 RepID=A0RXX3_CENSY|nr:conserved hypothetical protein [Cenarchaeum symbiosum A]
MNVRNMYALAALVALAGTASVPVLAQFEELPPACPDCEGDVRDLALMDRLRDVPITVWSDKTMYGHDSTITVNGQVAHVKPGTPVTLRVISPLNNLVSVEQIDVNSDGSFATDLRASGDLWKYDGTYTIRVQYGQGIDDKLLISLDGGITGDGDSRSACSSSEVAAGDQCIPFRIMGGDVTGADINVEDRSVTIRISSSTGGELILSPSSDTIDGIYLVLVDGQEEDADIDGNRVTVTFPAGATEVELVGTFVIPEFGTVAVLVLAVSIVSIIAVSARSRFGIMRTY